jgi:hypothetical protein
MAKGLYKFVHPLGTINGEWFRTAIEGQSLDKTKYAEKMVGMPVSDKDGIDSKPAPGAHHLLLRPFAAIE